MHPLSLASSPACYSLFFFFWKSQRLILKSTCRLTTNSSLLLSDERDAHLPHSAIHVYSGFALEHKKTAGQILGEVKRLMAEHFSTDVILFGHSLAELDSFFMRLNLPEGTTVRGVTFGTPRIAHSTRINNKRYVVPTVPGRQFGFWHPPEEIHIQGDGSVVACPGDDDGTDSQCSDLVVPNIGIGRIHDHLGPYHSIFIGTQACTS